MVDTNKYSFFATTNNGIANICAKEITSWQSKDATLAFQNISHGPTIVEFQGTLANAISYLQKGQLLKSLQLTLAKAKTVEELVISKKYIQVCSDIINENHKDNQPLAISVKVEDISGNETRIAIGGKVSQNIRNLIKDELGIDTKIDYKNQTYQFIVTKTNEEFILGIRLHQEYLDSREYRVYHHKAGYKGDFAAAFLHLLLRDPTIAFSNKEKILICQGRDGMFAIEAAHMLNKNKSISVRELDEDRLNQIPLCKQELTNRVDEEKELSSQNTKQITFATSSSPNLRSASANAKVAQIKESISFKKEGLDEYAFSFGSNEFDYAIIRMTRKDESDLNELFYQLSEVLKENAKALIIHREGLDMPISENFELLEQSFLLRGHGNHNYVLIKRKSN